MLNENILKRINIDAQSYLLLIYKIKPVLRFTLQANNFSYVEAILKKEKIKLFVKRIKKLQHTNLKNKILIGYVSLKKSDAEKAYKAERECDKYVFGKLLGYPSCCIESFNKTFPEDGVRASYRRTRGGRFSYYCNKIYNYDSRLVGDTPEVYLKNTFFFGKINNLFLTKHIPCSFDCAKTIEIGEATLKLLKKYFPEYTRKILSVVQNPVLYHGPFNWVTFRGKVTNNSIRYEDVVMGFIDHENLKLESFGKGGIVKVENDYVYISPKGKKDIVITNPEKQKLLILDFNENF